MIGRQRRDTIVIVVEDHALIQLNAMEFVEAAGFCAVGALDADQAMLMIREGSRPDILFTDIDMPGSMDGVELAYEMRRLFPAIGILIASGLRQPTGGQMPAGAQFLPKPYMFDQVANALEALRIHVPAMVLTR